MTEVIYSAKLTVSIRQVNMEKYIVDRFEGDFAVLEKETGGTIDVLIKSLPPLCEGDVVVFENGAYHKDSEETEKRKKMIAEKMRKLFEN